MVFHVDKVLKADAFGRIEKEIYFQKDGKGVPAIMRIYTKKPFFRMIAKILAKNETRALRKLASLNDARFPQLLEIDRHFHIRSYIEGDSMHRLPHQVTDHFFLQAKDLLRKMRRVGVANNDLAKEANWIITPNGSPTITDFQLAYCFGAGSKLGMHLSREDLRHLLKHKRKYRTVVSEERRLLHKKGWITRLWMASGKKIYLFITRKCLKWPDRSGPEERHI